MRDNGARVLLWSVGSLAAVVSISVLVLLSGGRLINFTLLLLANIIVLGDGMDLIARMYARRAALGSLAWRAGPSAVLPAGSEVELTQQIPLRPYAFVLSVHDLEPQIETFMRVMEPYKELTWIIDDCSNDHTLLRLRHAGWRCLQSDRNCKKPGAIKRLLDVVPRSFDTIVVMDPDVVLPAQRSDGSDGLARCIRDFQRSGAAAFCPRVICHGRGLISRLQAVEYALNCCLGRKSLLDFGVTSGVSFYRRDALERVLAQHSLSVYAEDLENSLLLTGHGERVYYDDRIVMDTTGKESWRAWFSQRVGWWYGLLRVYRTRWNEIRGVGRRCPFALYQYVFYTGLVTILLYPLKLASLFLITASTLNSADLLLGTALVPDVAITNPLLFAVSYCKYIVLMVCAIWLLPAHERRSAAWMIPFQYFYALAQIAPMGIGFANYLSVRHGGRRLYRDHYDDEPSIDVARVHVSHP
jgi:hypothetical protein